MDLPTCPACKQSVLDEDAVECPFCGADLKGGSPSSRTAAPAAPRSSPPAKLESTSKGSAERPQSSTGKPAPKSGAATKGLPGKSTKPDDDDPFAIDETAATKTIPVSPRPAAGKTLEVKCPMCETVGYVSSKAAGQQVKCCNPKCLVPIFSAPAPPKVEAPPPPPPKKSPLAIYAVIGVLVIGGGGFALWQILGTPAASPKLSDPSNPKKFHNPLLVDDTPPAETDPAAGDAKPATPQAPAELDLKTKALKKAVEVAVNAPLNRKAYCRRLAATAFVAAGDLEGAKDQLDQLQKVGTQTPYEGCLPTTWLAWAQIKDAPDAFTASVAEAKRLSSSLPKRGRYAVEAALGTAAVLAASGKSAEALDLLSSHPGAIELERLAAASQAVQHAGTFDLDTSLIGRTLGDWSAPRETGVVLILAAHSRWDEAQAWSAALTEPTARGEVTQAWAEAFVRAALATDPTIDLKRAEAATDALGPAVKARLLARLSGAALDLNNKEKADAYLVEANQLLTTLPPPGNISLTASRAIHDFKLPDPIPLRQAAEAAAEIGLVEARTGQLDRAWEHVELGLKFLRGTSPALGLMQQRSGELEGDAADRIRGELKSSLQLKTDDQVRRAFARYRLQVTELEQAAARRLFWQAEILEAAARGGLAEQVWNQLRVAEARPDVSEREPFFSTAVPLVLADQFARAGNADRQSASLAAAEGRFENASPQHQARITRELARQAIDAGDLSAAVERLNAMLHDDGTLHETALQLICRLIKAGKLKEANQLASGLRDTILREDGLFFAAALAARNGQSAEAWDFLPKSGAQLTETAAAVSGLTCGLSRAEKPR